MSKNAIQKRQDVSGGKFETVSANEWDTAVNGKSCSSVLMSDSWKEEVEEVLKFVTYHYFKYRDSHIIRLTEIAGRLTTAPFSDGSDVIAVGDDPVDLLKLQDDILAEFKISIRLRINERFAPTINSDETMITANEHVVLLDEPVLPRVRKTLRHTLSKPIEGSIKRSTEDNDIEAAYKLYLRHMRSVRNFSLPRSLFVSLIRDHGGELWTWSSENIPEAMAIFIPTDTEVLYSLSAASSDALKAHAPHHMVHKALEHYRSKGVKQVSLGSTGKGSALEVFKRGWRGEQYAIYELGPRQGGVKRTSSIRNLVRYVPLALYPLLTTKIGKYFF